MKRRLPDDWFPRELPAGLRMGQRSFLVSSYAFLHSAPSATIRIGSDTGIYHGTFFELGTAARVQIGDYCTLVGAILRVQSDLCIGNYALIAHEVVISDCETIGTAQYPTARPITIDDDVWIGMRAIILAGVTIGRGAVVGAGAVVTDDVPPMTIVSGNPARIVRKIAR
jgi:acetyltransferase-like isoleucine patch superfamily enzyme